MSPIVALCRRLNEKVRSSLQLFKVCCMMSRRVGNTNKLGAMFGILSAIGAPVPQPGSITFYIRLATNAIRSIFTGAAHD